MSIDGVVTYPADLQSKYRLMGYWGRETINDTYYRWVGAYSGRTAVVSEEAVWTYTELYERSTRLALYLSELGLKAEDIVVVQLPNSPDFIAVFFALVQLGAVPVLTLPGHRIREVKHVAEVSAANAYIGVDVYNGFDYRVIAETVKREVSSLQLTLCSCEGDRLYDVSPSTSHVAKLTPTEASSDIALMLLSGGTTGLPKLIPRTHADYIYNLSAGADLCGLKKRDRYLAALPMAHNFSLGCPGILGTLFAGGAVVLPSSPAAEDAFEAIELHRVSVTALVPSLVDLWLEAAQWEDWDLSSLRLMQVGGAKLSSTSAERILSTFPSVLQQVFGMAEGLLTYTRLTDARAVIVNTQGKPLCDADEVRVVGEDCNATADGQVGELLVRGPYTIRGYFRSEEYNKRAFTDDGFYRTGDLVVRNADGYITVEGRSKDTINRNGEKVAAEEIEAYLLEHPHIRDAAVIAENRGESRESIRAVIVEEEEVSLKSVRDFLASGDVPVFKWPDAITIVDRLPLTPIGKVNKTQLYSLISKGDTKAKQDSLE